MDWNEAKEEKASGDRNEPMRGHRSIEATRAASALDLLRTC